MQQIKPENNIERFVEAQDERWDSYDSALAEVKAGMKRSHWIWYIFPQLRGLGFSEMSYFFGISSRAEALEYLNHPKLGARLREVVAVLMTHTDKRAEQIFGALDAKKVCSSMTLFDAVCPNDVFNSVLEQFYGGRRCHKTLSILAREQ